MKMKHITFLFAFLLGAYVGRQTNMPLLGWWLLAFGTLLGNLNVIRVLLYNLIYRRRQVTADLSSCVLVIFGSSLFHGIALLIAAAGGRYL
jgi:hypothetical protein